MRDRVISLHAVRDPGINRNQHAWLTVVLRYCLLNWSFPCVVEPASNAALNFPRASSGRRRARSARTSGSSSIGKASWLAREELKTRCKLVWRDDLGVPGIGVEP